MATNLENLSFADAKSNLQSAGFSFDPSKVGNAQIGEVSDVRPEIDTAELESDQEFEVPQEEVGAEEQIQNIIGSIGTGLEDEDESLRGLEDTLVDLQGELGQQESERIELEQEQGLSDLRKEQRDIMQEARQIRASLTQGLVNEEGRRGVPLEVVTGRQAQLRKQAAADLAGLSAVNQAITGNIQTAQANIDRQLTLKYSALENQFNTLSTALEVNQDRFTRKEQRLARKRKAELEQARLQLQEKREDEKEANNAILTAIQNGMNASEASNLMKRVSSGDMEPVEVYSQLGGFLRDPLKQLQIQEAQLSVKQLQSEINASNNKNVNLADFTEAGTEEAVLAWIKDSAQFDKTIDQSQREKIEQVRLALGGLETLNGFLFSKAKEGGDDNLAKDYKALQTGRLQGKFLNVKQKLTGQTDVAGFNATIQGLIPTVARGIFGEVGVLTDVDIENYKKTLARLENTPEENKVIQTIMLDVLSRSLGNTLTTASQSGQNVSRFESTYVNTKERVEQLKIQLGQTGFEETEDEGLLESINTQSSTGNIFSDIQQEINKVNN